MNKQMSEVSEVKDLEGLVSFLFLPLMPAPVQVSLTNSLGTPRCLLSLDPCLLPVYIKWNVLFHPSRVLVIVIKLVFRARTSPRGRYYFFLI